eukprot:gene19125-biopygen10008
MASREVVQQWRWSGEKDVHLKITCRDGNSDPSYSSGRNRLEIEKPREQR